MDEHNSLNLEKIGRRGFDGHWAEGRRNLKMEKENIKRKEGDFGKQRGCNM
jgi:hypothetical protein